MQDQTLIAHYRARMYSIEPDLPEIGAYLRVYENDRDIGDYLQDSVRDCIEFAWEEFGVPTELWEEPEGS